MLHSISPEASALHEVRLRRQNPSLGPSDGTCPRCGTLATPTHGTYRSRRAKPGGLKAWSRSIPHPSLPKEVMWECNACHKTGRILSKPGKGRMLSFPSVYRMSKDSTTTQPTSIDTTIGELVRPGKAKQPPSTVPNSPAAPIQYMKARNQAHSDGAQSMTRGKVLAQLVRHGRGLQRAPARNKEKKVDPRQGQQVTQLGTIASFLDEL